MFEAIRRQTDMLSQLQYLIKDLKGSRLRAARATARLQELVSEAGPCGELTVMRVPLPLDPAVLLDGAQCWVGWRMGGRVLGSSPS